MANAFLNAQTFANVMLLLTKNQLVMGRLVDGQFKNEVTNENGLTTSIKRPPRFLDKKDGTANLALQDIVIGSVPVSVDQYSKVHLGVGDIDYIKSFNQLMQNSSMKSAASTLAHSIDGFLQDLTLGFHSWVAGQTSALGIDAADPTKGIANSSQASAAHTRLMDMGVPNSDLNGVLTFGDGQLIRGGLAGSNIQSENAPALLRTRIPMISEVDWYATQMTPALTMGTRAQSAGATVNLGAQNVNYRDVKTTMTQNFNLKTLVANNTIKKGEVFTIAGVFAWDWRRGVALDYLQQFTVLADVTVGAAATTATVSISPAIIVQGTNDGTDTVANTVFGTVDSIPADGAAVTWVGAAGAKARVRSVFHKQAIALVSARLATPYTGVSAFATDPETGISLRYWRGSDISNGQHIHRWDCMYGGVVAQPFLGTRVCGT